MAELKIVTRKDTYALQKPKVYFCAHTSELQKHLKSITDLVLTYSDCAVFYKDPTLDYGDGEHLSSIAEMQLVVAPISSRLLTDPDGGINEIRYAAESRIPILPIVVEAGLSELFNKEFPALQYVDRTSNDPTGIRFEKKIESFLSAVLIGDELAEKIRAAFDAYVFLSY